MADVKFERRARRIRRYQDTRKILKFPYPKKVPANAEAKASEAKLAVVKK